MYFKKTMLTMLLSALWWAYKKHKQTNKKTLQTQFSFVNKMQDQLNTSMFMACVSIEGNP